MHSSQKSILIVDDHAVVRHGLRRLIEDESDLVVCGEAESAGEVLALIAEEQPDLVLLDITLDSGLNGIEVTKQLRAHHPEVPVLVLSMHEEMLYAERALQAGARGYLMKRTSNEEILEALRTVLRGRVYVSKAVEGQAFPLGAGGAPAEDAAPVDRLSDRELEIFRWVGEGYPPRDIAERLALSVKTIETHRRRIRQKLNLEDATALIRYAVQWHKDQQSV